MNNKELTDYIMKPENQEYTEISLSKNWGLSNHVAKLNGLKYIHRGIKQLDEKIVLTKEWKNKNYNVPPDLIGFLQNFSSPFYNEKLTKENLNLKKIVKGKRATERHTFGFFAGFFGGVMGLIPTFDMFKNNLEGNLPYYALAGCGALLFYGVYSVVAMAKDFGTKEYNKFERIIDSAENADYFIRKNMSKEVFEQIRK